MAVPRSGPGRRFVLAAATLGVCAAVESAAQHTDDIPVLRLEAIYGRQSQPQSPALPVTRLDDGERSGDLDVARAGSVTLSEPQPIREVLLLLFRGTPFSVVFDPAATGTFVGELSNLSLRQAVEAVLFPAGLDYDRQGRVIHVFPRRTQTRLFEVSHVDVRRAWRRSVVSRVSTDGASAAADLTSAVDSDFFGELATGIQALLSPSGRVHVDRKSGVVQVTDFADRLEQVGFFVETVTLRATRQVRLSARVFEVELGDYLAIDWAAVGRSAGLKAGTGAGIDVPDFDLLLRAIGAFGTVRMIATPQMLAMNNEPAVMRIGSHEAGFVREADVRGASGGALRAAPVEGLTLTVTPQISADGIVHMSVSPSFVDTHRDSTPAAAVFEVDTTMRVRGGETVVISGLLRERSQAVAASGVAGIFGGKDRRLNRTELVVLLTPTVVNAGSSPVAGAQ
jgi:MSHA biogenesis protein MshL